MPTVPDFSQLIISRPSSTALASARLGGLILAGAIYGLGVVALIVTPFFMLEMMPPPRAGIAALEPPISVDIRRLRGGGQVREGVKDGTGHSRRSSATRPRQTRAVPRPVDTKLPPPESEIESPTTQADGPEGPGRQ